MTDQRRLAFYAAILFLLGGLTGIPIGAARTGSLDADPGSLLGAHTAALQGALWLVAVAWSLPMVHLSAGARRVLVTAVPLATFSNWLVTAVKAFLHVRGVALEGHAANDAVLGVLTLLVVTPTLTACVLWAWGLRAAAAGPGAAR